MNTKIKGFVRVHTGTYQIQSINNVSRAKNFFLALQVNVRTLDRVSELRAYYPIFF